MRKLIEKTKYITLIAVLSLGITSLFAMFWGIAKMVKTLSAIITSYGTDEYINLYLIQVVDAFLISILLFIFAVSIYELFIGELEMPDWLVTHNFHQLKVRLSSAIILVLGVLFLEQVIKSKDAQAILYEGIGVAVVAGALIAFNVFGEKNE